MTTWTLEDIPWEEFDASRVDADTIKVVKAASLVEHNGTDYETYLCNVFRLDPEFQDKARDWAKEEVKHGQVLRRWAELADPTFDFPAAFKRFTEGFRLDLGTATSIRGSLSGELIARCVIEAGTSSWYTALKDGTDEPVLKAICRHVAADELRHYKLFYDYLKRYLDAEQLGRWGRLRVALGRVTETEGDELAYAYYAANGRDDGYNRKTFNREYARCAYAFYRQHHVERGVAMICKVVGLDPQGRVQRVAANLAWRVVDTRSRRLARLAA